MIALSLIGVVFMVIGIGHVIVKLSKADYNIDYVSVVATIITGILMSLPLILSNPEI